MAQPQGQPHIVLRLLNNRRYGLVRHGHLTTSVMTHYPLVFNMDEVNHLVILVDQNIKLLANKGILINRDNVWFPDIDTTNMLPKGRNLICFCNMKNLTHHELFSHAEEKLCLRLKHRRRHLIKRIRITEDEVKKKASPGTLLMITSKRTPDSLRFLCHAKLTEEDLHKARADNNADTRDSMILDGRKLNLKIRVKNNLVPSCICSRWEEPAAAGNDMPNAVEPVAPQADRQEEPLTSEEEY